MQTETKATLLLILVTAIWGLTFPLIHNAVTHIAPLTFIFVRFSLATVFLLPMIWQALRQTNLPLLFASVIIGLLNSVTYIAQTIGLQTTTSARAAFITSTSVILVPFLMPVFGFGKPTGFEIFCSLICLAGLYILTGADITHISSGDKWVLLCAIANAFSIIYLQRVTQKHKEYKLLTFYPIVIVALASAVFVPDKFNSTLLQLPVIIGVGFCSIFATCIALWLQTKYQKFAPAPKVALIFCLEPLFASIFGLVINGDAITHNIMLGGAFILMSLMLPELRRLKL